MDPRSTLPASGAGRHGVAEAAADAEAMAVAQSPGTGRWQRPAPSRGRSSAHVAPARCQLPAPVAAAVSVLCTSDSQHPELPQLQRTRVTMSASWTTVRRLKQLLSSAVGPGEALCSVLRGAAGAPSQGCHACSATPWAVAVWHAGQRGRGAPAAKTIRGLPADDRGRSRVHVRPSGRSSRASAGTTLVQSPGPTSRVSQTALVPKSSVRAATPASDAARSTPAPLPRPAQVKMTLHFPTGQVQIQDMLQRRPLRRMRPPQKLFPTRLSVAKARKRCAACPTRRQQRHHPQNDLKMALQLPGSKAPSTSAADAPAWATRRATRAPLQSLMFDCCVPHVRCSGLMQLLSQQTTCLATCPATGGGPLVRQHTRR